MSDKINADEVVRSLNGFEDIAIEKMFGLPLMKMDEMRAPRALVFVLRKRDGLNDAQAHTAAMEMTFGELTDLFETEDEDAIGTLDGPGN